MVGRRLILRGGDPLRAEQLAGADARHAVAIIVPGDDYGTDEAAAHDACVLQIAMSLSQSRMFRFEAPPTGASTLAAVRSEDASCWAPAPRSP